MTNKNIYYIYDYYENEFIKDKLISPCCNAKLQWFGKGTTENTKHGKLKIYQCSKCQQPLHVRLEKGIND